MPKETIVLDVTIEHDDDEALDNAIEAIITAVENTNTGQGTRILKVYLA